MVFVKERIKSIIQNSKHEKNNCERILMVFSYYTGRCPTFLFVSLLYRFCRERKNMQVIAATFTMQIFLIGFLVNCIGVYLARLIVVAFQTLSGK